MRITSIVAITLLLVASTIAQTQVESEVESKSLKCVNSLTKTLAGINKLKNDLKHKESFADDFKDFETLLEDVKADIANCTDLTRQELIDFVYHHLPAHIQTCMFDIYQLGIQLKQTIKEFKDKEMVVGIEDILKIVEIAKIVIQDCKEIHL